MDLFCFWSIFSVDILYTVTKHLIVRVSDHSGKYLDPIYTMLVLFERRRLCRFHVIFLPVSWKHKACFQIVLASCKWGLSFLQSHCSTRLRLWNYGGSGKQNCFPQLY